MRRLAGGRIRLLLAVALTLALVATGWRLWPRPPLSSHASSSTAIYSADGKLLRLTLSSDEKYRLWVPLEQIAPALVEAVLLHEDRRFYWHCGVNPWSLARGAWKTYVGGDRQGGSTVTMQLARLLYRLDTRRPAGKLQQSLRALQLELSHSKRDILEAYLNLVPYSNNIEGVAAASLVYYGKAPSRLHLPEALTLAVIPQSPARRNPGGDNAALGVARQKLFGVWRRTHAVAAGDEDLLALPIRLGAIGDLPFRAPHFTTALVAERPTQPQIASTLDLGLQRTLERQIQQYVARQRSVGIVNAAAMLVDYRSMEVKAVVGSADFFDAAISGQVNGTLARRSPGSALKPFLYALAIDQGLIHPLSVLKDAPTAFGPYSPENFDGHFVGPITAQEALVRSRNVPAVALAARLANPSFHDFLRAAGIGQLRSERFYGLGVVLGGVEVTMEELVTLYAALANRGRLRPLRYREDDVNPEGVRILSEEASFMTLDMLRQNPRPDLAYAARASVLPVYWKTGTSWGFRDAWTAGIFGPYVLAVWVGNFDGEGNPAFVGVQAAAPLFFEIADSVRAQHRHLYEPAFPAPLNLVRVEVCAASGDLPNSYCPVRAQTWFIPGKSPIHVSDVHRPVAIDERTGEQACPPYDSAQVRMEVYEFWSSDMLRLFQQAGMPRRAPPPLPRNCVPPGGASGSGPKILSPLRGTTYTLRTRSSASETIALQASVDADVGDLFWFVNDRFIARVAAGSTYLWTPGGPGTYIVRAVDDLGRSDARDLSISLVP